MKRSLVAGFGLLALAAAMPASAADLPRGPCPTRPRPSSRLYNWTGFYPGINGGYAWGNSDWNGLGVNNQPAGGLIGSPPVTTGRAPAARGCSASRATSTGRPSKAAPRAPASYLPDQDQLVRHRARPRRLCVRPGHALRDGRRCLRRHRSERGTVRRREGHQRRLDARRRRRGRHRRQLDRQGRVSLRRSRHQHTATRLCAAAAPTSIFS